MVKKLVFEEAIKAHFPILKKYIPIVAKVHGGSHPEFHEVHRLFDAIGGKIQDVASNKVKLNKEFIKLREVTDNYKIPEDVCESYEAVYNMLGELDNAYHT